MNNKRYLIQKKIINTKLFRFAAVGVLNTVFGYGLYCLLVYVNVSTDLAVLISTIAGVLFNFKTTGAFVFKNSNNKLLFKFIGSYAITYFINIALIRVFVSTGFLNKYYAGLIATIIIAGISFLIQNFFVFNSKKDSYEKED